MLSNTPQVTVNSWVGLEKQRFNSVGFMGNFGRFYFAVK